MGKLLDRLGSSVLLWQPVYEKENFEFESIKLCLKIDFMLHPACGLGVG